MMRAGDAARVPDVFRGVAVHYEDVGAAAGGNLSQLIPAELERIVVGGRGQRLARESPSRTSSSSSVCMEMPAMVPDADAPEAAR
jgi:hypothetical protein